jgi:hypothetical protein
MSGDGSEAAAHATRLRELRVARAQTWFYDWHYAEYFAVSFDAGGGEATEELQEALADLTACVPELVAIDYDSPQTGYGILIFAADEGTLVVELNRAVRESTDERLTIRSSRHGCGLRYAHTRPTWRRLEPERFDVRVLEPAG